MPFITHGNLTCDTIYINHNGLIKLSPVALGILSSTVKAAAHQQFLRHLHYKAPELWLEANSPSPSASAGSLDSESIAEVDRRFSTSAVCSVSHISYVVE